MKTLVTLRIPSKPDDDIIRVWADNNTFTVNEVLNVHYPDGSNCLYRIASKEVSTSIYTVADISPSDVFWADRT